MGGRSCFAGVAEEPVVQVGGGGSGSRWVGGWPRLVRPHDQVQIVALEEFLHHVRPEGVRHLRRRRGGWERVRGARRGAERAGSGGAATPRSFSAHPVISASGSDQSVSHSMPVSGTSTGRATRFRSEGELMSGDSPPWMQKILPSTTAASGRLLKSSWKLFHSLIE